MSFFLFALIVCVIGVIVNGCNFDESSVRIYLFDESSFDWSLSDSSGLELISRVSAAVDGGNYIVDSISCVASDDCYFVTIYSAAGGNGVNYNVESDGIAVANGILTDDTFRISFIFCAANIIFAKDPPCAAVESQVTVSIVPDNFPEELVWFIKDFYGNVVAYETGHTVNYLEVFKTFCLSVGSYSISMYDTYGDGIYGGTSVQTGYKVIVDNQEKVFVRSDDFDGSVDRQYFGVVLDSPTNDQCPDIPCKRGDAGACLVYQNSHQGCSQCVQHYWKISSNYPCIHCQDTFGSSCMHCADGIGCQQCQTGFYRRQYSDGLYYCDPDPCRCFDAHCNVCNNGYCSQCEAGYIRVEQEAEFCVPCYNFGEGCLHCADFNGCQQCDSGYQMETNQFNQLNYCIDLNQVEK